MEGLLLNLRASQRVVKFVFVAVVLSTMIKSNHDLSDSPGV